MPLYSALPEESQCLSYLEKIRWNGIVISPFEPTSKVYKCSGNRYKCRDSGKYFNAKTQTIFHHSRISLRKWFMAIILVSESRKMTSTQLSVDLGTTQKTAWYILQRLNKTVSNDIDATVFLHRNYIQNIDVIVERDRLKLVEWLNLIK